MKKRILATLLSLCLVIGLLPVTALAAEESSWAGCESCSAENPHMIYTKADLNKIRTHIVSGNITGYFKLANDIEFETSDFAEGGAYYNDGQGWIPLDGVGWSVAFTGTLDGNGKKIAGIQSDAKAIKDGLDWRGVGLFSYVNGATVKNLTLEGFKLYKSESENPESTREEAGALSGYVDKASIDHVSVVDSEMYGSRCGGIAGYGIRSSFKDCTVKNVTIHSYGNCGGIIGAVRSGVTVDGCNIQVSIPCAPGEERVGWRAYHGGVWGGQGFGDFAKQKNAIKNTTVDFTYSSTNQGYVGGLIGGHHLSAGDTQVDIDNVAIKVDIKTGIGNVVGGIFGQLNSHSTLGACHVSNVFVTGTISTDESITPAAIGSCYGGNQNVELNNIYSNLTRKETGEAFPAVLIGNKPSLTNCVFTGGETVQEENLKEGFSYQKVTNPIECSYGATITDWCQTVGEPEATLTFTTPNDGIIHLSENNEIVADKAGKTTIAVKTTMMGKEIKLCSIPVTVSPKAVAVTMSDTPVTYDGSTKTIAATSGTEEALPGDLNLVYSYKKSDADDSTYTTTQPKDAGTYTVKVESGNPNYELTGKTTATLTIDPASLSGAVVTPTQDTFKYQDGAAITPDVTVVLGGKVLVKGQDYEVAYENNTNVTTVSSKASVTVTGKGNYTESKTANFEIVNGDAPTVEITANQVTYDGNSHNVEVKASSGTVTYYKNAEMTEPFTGISAAGTYPVYYKIESITGYQGIVSGSTTLTITPATLTVTADNKAIYVGQALPEYTYTVSGLKGTDKLTKNPTVTCTSADNSKAGTYTITAGGATASENYTITYVNGTLTVYAYSSGGSSSSNTSTSTTTNKDGSTTTTTTNKATGTVTEVTKAKDGTTTTVETKKDGTVTETVKLPDGTTGTVVTDKNGEVTEVTASVSSTAARNANKAGEAVTLPVEVPAAKTTEDAPAVQVTVPKSAGSVKVEIPVEKVTPGTVAVLVDAKGNEKIVATSVTTENGVALALDGSATVKVIDNSKSFTDVPADHVFYNEVASLSAREIMVGKTDDKFDLHNSVTLNQIANVAGRIIGAVDVKDYNAGIAWGAENGLKTGNVPATRGDVLKALYIAAGSPAVEDTSVLARFTDSASIPADLTAAAAWAAQNGILKGNVDGSAGLGNNVTRGQACALAGRTMATLA